MKEPITLAAERSWEEKGEPRESSTFPLETQSASEDCGWPANRSTLGRFISLNRHLSPSPRCADGVHSSCFQCPLSSTSSLTWLEGPAVVPSSPSPILHSRVMEESTTVPPPALVSHRTSPASHTKRNTDCAPAHWSIMGPSTRVHPATAAFHTTRWPVGAATAVGVQNLFMASTGTP